MKNHIQKTATLLATLIVIGLIFGNALLAEDRGPGDLITAADQAFIKASPRGVVTPIDTAVQVQPVGLITAVDNTFIRSPFAELTGNWQVRRALDTTGVITAADYKFLTTGTAVDVFSAYSDLADSLARRQVK